MPWPPPPSAARTRVAAAAVAHLKPLVGQPLPRVLHVIWMQGEEDLPRPLRDTLGANREHAARRGWRVRVWSAADIAELLAAEREEAWGARFAALRAARSVHAAADYGRYCVAYLRGGAVLDADARVLGDPFALADAAGDRVGHGGVTVLGRTPLSPLGARVATLGASAQHLSTAVLVTSPRRAVWRLFIDGIPRVAPARLEDGAPPLGALLSCVALGGGDASDALAAQLTTGSLYFSDYWLRAEARGDARIVPAPVFEPCRLDGATCDVTPDTVVLHTRTLSWLPPATAAAVRAVSAHSSAVPLAVGGLAALLLLLVLAAQLLHNSAERAAAATAAAAAAEVVP
jgi:hypothetical protein